jgi:cytochrome c-type biogenesis protein CcmF
VSLVIVTFFLTVVGTFLTRSGVVQSVHAFGEDRQLAWMFGVFMALTLAVSFALVIYRMPLLRSRNELDSWASREAAFLANNWILLFSAFFVLFATMFPTMSEAVTGNRLTVGPPFFNQWMTPIGYGLLFLTGVGPLLAWRKSTASNLVSQFLWPVLSFIVVAGAGAAVGVPFWPSGLCFALCAFVGATMTQEFVRGALVRKTTTGTDVFTALVGLVSRSRRRYGGYIVHLGIVLMFLGFAGNSFNREETALLTPGQRVMVSPYTVVFNTLAVTEDAAKQMITADVEVWRDGRALGSMYPARWFFAGREQEPTTEVALRRGMADDVYLVLAGYDVSTQTATLVVHVNPLVNWVWFGVGVLIIGAVIAYLPERAFAFATSRVPDRSVTTSLLVLLAIASAPGIALAQGTGVVERTALERELADEVMCTCGGCRLPAGTCGMANCHGKEEQLAKLRRLVTEGKTRDEILAVFVRDHGSEDILMRPPDSAFNRLAWLFPYALGAVGIVTVGIVARRWSQHQQPIDDPSRASSGRPDLEDRLDDELRDLD